MTWDGCKRCALGKTVVRGGFSGPGRSGLTLGLVCLVPESVVAILRCVGRDCAPRYMAWGIENGRRHVDW